MLARLLLALMVLLPLPAAAQTSAVSQAPAGAAQPSLAARMLAGSWVLRVDGVVVFRFDIARSGEGWSGTWAKPRSFASDGANFAELSGPPIEQASQRGRVIGEWAELTFGDARPGAVPDVFRFRLLSPERAEMIYTDTGHAPFLLERVDQGTAPGPWDAGRVYRRAGVQPGTLVSYNLGPRIVPAPAPADAEAPAEPDRPPAIIGR